MSPERWKQIAALYHSALQRQPSQRAAFLAEACQGDEELKREVESLANWGDHSEGLLDRHPFAPEYGELHPEAIPTQTFAEKGAQGSNRVHNSRFPPGSTLNNRYRIMGLLGQGGMGEVYRATDLRLDQTVALKFLPQTTVGNPQLLRRFNGEVRIARQISHPNVCRVYELQETDGTPFITMEYVDGEDLASLLRRIGRLSADKSIEIARRLCAGIAAAHAHGVLHRDLKPANIMIDGRGQVRIMDFGLAALAEDITGTEVRDGTPAYMAPEQLDGREATVRSDLYSLGLVLYEMLTGARAFDGRGRGFLPDPAMLGKDVDPAMVSLLRCCLDPDPSKRPPSALALARALPGGDPLAEALAAGETPSPEMVAASDDTSTISIGTAVACLLFILAGLVGVVALSGYTNPLRMTPAPLPSEVLVQKARDIVARLGYAGTPLDSAYGFGEDSNYSYYAGTKLKPGEYRKLIAAGQPAIVHFWYRQSPNYLVRSDGYVDEGDPPYTTSNMVYVALDLQGRLLNFLAVPEYWESRTPSPRPLDWSVLFEVAGLDKSRWLPAATETVPTVPFDTRAGWTGTYPQTPFMPMRIQAAS